MEELKEKNEMRLPDFFLVGAPKSGTTSLYEYLGQHPQIFTPPIKEPHFFACPEVKDTYYDVPFVDTMTEYVEIFKESKNTQKAGDFSSSYLHRERAACRIKHHCPESKILILLRDPVERAISHYLMDVRDGYQPYSLMECLKGAKKLRPYYREYVEVGLYSKQIKRYKSLFDSSDVKIITFKELTNETKKVLENISHFIEVENFRGWNVSDQHNSYRSFKSSYFGRAVKHEWVQEFSSIVPGSLKEVIKRIIFTSEKPDFEKERKKLKNIFRKDIKKLNPIINKDISHWSR